ncbi:MAG: hypothetical protein LBQ81_11740 [Zoogloeaceae bacterium]|jgi:hypothetical protein|nr:hypothetical protein [Zoogloeaceae bacterium]
MTEQQLEALCGKLHDRLSEIRAIARVLPCHGYIDALAAREMCNYLSSAIANLADQGLSTCSELEIEALAALCPRSEEEPQ